MDKFVAPNSISLGQAYVTLVNNELTPIPFAIYNDDVMVGFIMMSYVKEEQDEDIDEDIYEVWRFMIDVKYQGKGYGRASLLKAIEYVKTMPYGKANKLLLSYVPGNERGSNLYASVGFVETGDISHGEVVMSYDLTK